MPTCPSCSELLQKVRQPNHVFWACPACGGRSATIPLLRRLMPRQVVNDLWMRIREGTSPKIRPCPFCAKKMDQIAVNEQPFSIDACRLCTVVWFDPKEFEAFPLQEDTSSTPKEEMPQEIQQMLAIQQIKQMREHAKSTKTSPDEIWKIIPAFLGMPVEFDGACKTIYPITTWIMASIILIISLISFTDSESIIMRLGLIPAEAMRLGGLTFFASFFLHGGIGHLAGNLYYLLVFGDNVEEDLGVLHFLILLFGAAFVGDVAHIMTDSASTIPCIGASGGISGLLMYYALLHPRKYVGIIFWFRWVRFPVWVYFLFWVTLQIIGETMGTSHVSYAAHLGGALAGAIYWVVQKFVITNTRPSTNYV